MNKLFLMAAGILLSAGLIGLAARPSEGDEKQECKTTSCTQTCDKSTCDETDCPIVCCPPCK